MSKLPSCYSHVTKPRFRHTRTPAPKELNNYRPASLTRHDSFVTNLHWQQPSVEPCFQIPHPTGAHMHATAFVGPTETENSNNRIRARSTSFSNSTRSNLPLVNNLSHHLASPQAQKCQASNNVMPDPRRVFEQDKHVRMSPLAPSIMQETSVYHSDYVPVEPKRCSRSDYIQ